MNIAPIVRTKMLEAMKAKNKEDRAAYAYLVDVLEKERKNKQNDENPNPVLTDEEEIAVIQFQVKQSKKAITDARSGHAKDAEAQATIDKFCAEREHEIKLFSEFLPKQMSEEEILEAIRAVYGKIPEDARANINKGVIMKNLMPAVKGKADGKLVSETVEKFITDLKAENLS